MIEVKDIVKTFNENSRNANTVLDHASITFPDHGFVFIVGKSGIGKSTILNSIGGLISYNGEILYDGKKENIEEYRRQNIGYIFQDFLLFDDLSVRENIKIGLNIAGVYDEKEITKRVNILLKAVGLNINARRSAKALSLGQRQRVAIARALASNPKIILADEPTGNLDSKNSLNVMKILKKLSKDHLIICVTHNVNLVHLFADYAFAIKDKKFVQIDPKEENLDDIYVQNRIDITSLNKKEIKEQNLSFKIYSDDSTVESKLTIINRGGKIVIIGDNVSLANKEDLSLINTLESQENDEASEVSTVEIVDGEELPDINFESKNEKRKFKDTVLYKTLNDMFSLENFKYKKKKKFFHFVSMVIPLIVYLLLDVCFGVLSGLDSLMFSKIKYQSDNVLVAVSKDNLGFGMSAEEITDLIEDKDSHIIEANNQLNLYTEDGRFVNSNRSKGDYYDDDNIVYPETSTNYVVSTNGRGIKNAIYSLESSYFTVFNKIISPSRNYFDPKVSFSDINDYVNIASDLKDVTLNDDEIIVDKGIFLTTNTSTFEFPSGDIYSNMKDTYLNLPYCDSYERTRTLKFKIVDVKDTGFATIFCNTKTYQKMIMMNLINYVTDFSSINKTFENYEVVNFDTLDETKYNFYKVDENDVSTTLTKSELNGYWNNNEDSLITTIREGLSVTEGYSVGFASKSVLNDCTICKSSDSKIIYSNGTFLAPSEIYVENKADHNKKVVVLQDCLNSNNKINKSYDNFIENVILTSVIFNSTIDENLIGNTISIPKKYQSILEDKENLISNMDLDQDYVINDTDDKFYYSKDFFTKAKSKIYSKFEISGVSYFNDSKETISFSNFNAYFVSNDVEKTLQYMQDNSDKYNFTLKRYADVKSIVLNESMSSVLVPFVFVISILVICMILVLVLQSVSKVNKMKYEFGVLRCLGKPIPQIISDYLASSLINYFLSCFIPTVLLTLVLIGLDLYYIGFFFVLYLVIMFAISILSDLIPLLITISKKPYQILKNLN